MKKLSISGLSLLGLLFILSLGCQQKSSPTSETEKVKTEQLNKELDSLSNELHKSSQQLQQETQAVTDSIDKILEEI